MTKTINIFAPISYGVAIWLGISSRVDWWIIILLILFVTKINITFKN